MIPNHFYHEFALKWAEHPVVNDTKVTQYETLQSLEYDNITSADIMVKVKVTFCRKHSLVQNVWIRVKTTIFDNQFFENDDI